MSMRRALIAALRGDSDVFAESLREKMDDDGPMATVAQAAEALEPIIADAVQRHPSRIGKIGLKSANLLANLVLEDRRSNRKLARIAGGSTVGIVFVDVAGFMTFTAEKGDRVAVRLLRRLGDLIARTIGPLKGECVKQLGDGFLLAFPSASQAVKGAVAVRDAVVNARRRDPEFDVHVRVAVHAGEPSVERDDLLGHDVNLTARLLDHCDPDEVVASGAAKELAEKRLKKVAFTGRRDVKIRGLSTRVPVYRAAPIPAPSRR